LRPKSISSASKPRDFPSPQIEDPTLGGPEGDADGDGATNLSEFLSATEPNDPGSVIHTSRPAQYLDPGNRSGTGDNVLIGGFIITGSTPEGGAAARDRSVVNRCRADRSPARPDARAARRFRCDYRLPNDDWRTAQETEIEMTGAPPTDDRESASIMTLDPGPIHGHCPSGKTAPTGTALVEAYDLDSTPASQFGDISTRGFVGNRERRFDRRTDRFGRSNRVRPMW
jgi:hypothetical protein